ncbi:MAG: hypothetical protein E7449_04710 [Ruminococcaceae bacterium]|nr:hypothetical protein [Oscillospiraceae bacterium]
MKRDVWQGVLYFLQLGLSLAAPPVGLCLLARWGSARFGLGGWVSVTALIVGGGISLATSVSLLRAFRRMEHGKERK